jgi:hypothetical protein
MVCRPGDYDPVWHCAAGQMNGAALPSRGRDRVAGRAPTRSLPEVRWALLLPGSNQDTPDPASGLSLGFDMSCSSTR